ncbi:hypothetical protein QP028_08535 [Corynebacterium suedekumii]|nr:hypothetical protein QP028_08535 [Corynebacterium suedekumii]
MLILLAGTLHLLYVLRVGGDFMHGRMLLLPIFALLLPLAVVPVIDLTHPRRIFDVLLGAGVVAVSWWGIATVIDGHELDWDDGEGDLGIVDERDFWAYATFRGRGPAAGGRGLPQRPGDERLRGHRHPHRRRGRGPDVPVPAGPGELLLGISPAPRSRPPRIRPGSASCRPPSTTSTWA